MNQKWNENQTLSIRPLPPALQEIAIKELNEDPDRLEEDLKTLEEWLAKQPHLNVRTERQWLVAFLRRSKFSLQRTKEKLDYFYTIKTMAPEILGIKDPLLPQIQRGLDCRIAVASHKALSKTNLPVLLMCRSEFVDLTKLHLLDACKTLFMYLEVLLYTADIATVAGHYVVIDLKGFPPGLLKEFTPSLVKKIVIALAKSYPCRIKCVYCINVHPIYESLINMFKMFATAKLAQRIKILREDNFEQIYREIPYHVFPKEYGGQAGTWDELAAETKAILEAHRDWLMEGTKHFTDETKRPGKPKTSAELLGIEGSFRKLNID